MAMQMEWYRMFYETAKAGNVTKAAERLYVTQPSVSYALKQLEGSLGLKLFRRLSKGVELTAEGSALLAYVEEAFALLGAGERKLGELKRLAAGDVRIGVSDSLVKHVLLPQLDSYRAAYPGIRIRLSHGKTPDIAARVREGTIDMGIVHLPLDDPQFDVTTLCESEEAFVGGERYRALAGRELSAEELGALPLLLLSAGSSSRQYVERWFAAQGNMHVEPDIELGSVELLALFARRGYGVAVVAKAFVAQELADGVLHELTPAYPLPPRQIGIAVRRGVPLSAASGRFIEELRSAYRIHV